MPILAPSSSASIDSTALPALPLLPLLTLALACFVTILTEALPAGLLPQISAGLGVSEALAGQLVTIYAIGSLLAAIPLTAATQGLRRRPVLLAAIAGFAIANTVTTLSDSYTITLAARFVAGVSAGLLWALLAGYAARMVPAHQRGKAIAIAMVGAPLALSLGVPAGTLLGNLVGWRTCFGIMSLLALALMVVVRLKVPDYAGQAAGSRQSLGRVLTLPGIRSVLFVVLALVLAHNVLYTYIASFLAAAEMAGEAAIGTAAGMPAGRTADLMAGMTTGLTSASTAASEAGVTAGIVARTDLVLLVFGIASLLSIWLVGVLIDRHLRTLTLASTALFALAALVLGVAGGNPVWIYLAVAAWGIAFGGAATLFQTAMAHTAGDAADVAQAMLVTAWNLAIAGGGLIGGLLLDQYGVGAFSPALLILLMATGGVVMAAKRHGFAAVAL